MHQYFGYIRVSTAKQGEKGVSLQEQKDSISAFAERFGLEIGRWFEERETAAQRGRPIFTQMLRLLKQKGGRGVIIHKIDRSARNLRDWADLGEMIDSGIEVHFANESLDLHTRGGRLSADIQAVVASDFIRNLREETKKGFYGRLKQGFYPLGAPIGYLDHGKAKAKTLDPERAPLVAQAFALYATGKYSLLQLVHEMDRRGLRNKYGGKVSRNGMSVLLNNPFYTGLIQIKKTGEFFEGKHQPLVRKALFERVNQILSGKSVFRTVQHDFAFRRMLRCGGCGYSLSGETQKGHVYYRCQTPTCPTNTIREERLDEQLGQVVFDRLRLDDWEIEYAKGWVKNAHIKAETFRDQEMQNCRLLLDQNRLRKTRLTDAFLDGGIDKEAFEERKAGLLMEETGLKDRLAHLGQDGRSAVTRLENFLELAKTASILYKQGLLEEKRDLVQKLTSNLTLAEKNLSVELKTEARMIANRQKIACSSPERDAPRTAANLELDCMLENLLKHFSADAAR
jgi:site-specific DNA recombinase